MKLLKALRILFRPDRRGARRPRTRLFLELLEDRTTPVIPAGLTDVPMLLWWESPNAGYAETHDYTRTETSTLTVDQSGSGSTGTFSILTTSGPA
jgi:hypothetical protein